jgi:hypothetical protein
MNKERELLERILNHMSGKDRPYFIATCKEIKELLTQPETEQEPVAWITEWVQRYRHNDTPIIDRAVSFTKGEAPAVPNPNYIPLYLAPPKREPLSEDEMYIGFQTAIGNYIDLTSFIAGVKSAEKEHGIGLDD